VLIRFRKFAAPRSLLIFVVKFLFLVFLRDRAEPVGKSDIQSSRFASIDYSLAQSWNLKFKVAFQGPKISEALAIKESFPSQSSCRNPRLTAVLGKYSPWGVSRKELTCERTCSLVPFVIFRLVVSVPLQDILD